MSETTVKLCECGCGQPAPIAKRNNPKKGHVVGRPTRFIQGHHNKVRQFRPLAERFWEKVDKRGPDDCWEWQGYRGPNGHGQMRGTPGTTAAHRVSWELHNGPIPEGLHICHHCDNPPCVNPAHLFLGTHQDNMRDMVEKGRNSKPPVHRIKGEGSTNAHFTNAQVREFRRQFAEMDISVLRFAGLHNVHPATMRKILKRLSYPNA